MKRNSSKITTNCLRKYRKARGLNQKQVAAILGLKSTGMISRWEKGVCLPDTINIFKLSILYRTLIEALFIDHVHELRAGLYQKEETILSKSDN